MARQSRIPLKLGFQSDSEAADVAMITPRAMRAHRESIARVYPYSSKDGSSPSSAAAALSARGESPLGSARYKPVGVTSNKEQPHVDTVTFETLLSDPHARGFLKKFMVEQFCQENIVFWEHVEAFKATKSCYDRLSQAQQIFEDFLEPSGKFRLNLSDHDIKVCKETFEKIVAALPEIEHTYELEFKAHLRSYQAGSSSMGELLNEQACPTNLFEPVQKLILIQLKSDLYPRFVESQWYNELIAQQHVLNNNNNNNNNNSDHHNHHNHCCLRKSHRRTETFSSMDLSSTVAEAPSPYQ